MVQTIYVCERCGAKYMDKPHAIQCEVRDVRKTRRALRAFLEPSGVSNVHVRSDCIRSDGEIDCNCAPNCAVCFGDV